MSEPWGNLQTFLSSSAFKLTSFFVLTSILLIGLLPVIGKWKIYTKAGYPGWAIFIPFYNDYVLIRVAGLPWWAFPAKLLITYIVPSVDNLVNIGISILVAIAFGRSVFFGIGLGLLPFIFYPVLGLGKSEYRHPSYLRFGHRRNLSINPPKSILYGEMDKEE